MMRSLSLLQHRRDEGPVDLQLVDRHLAQVGQRGVAGAEVVDRQARAEVAQPGHGGQRPLGVGHDHALGDLELERLRRQAVGVQQTLDLLGQVAVQQVAHRQVDRHRQFAPVLAPGGALGDGALQHVTGERADEAGLLDGLHEGAGRDQAVLGVLPADQALGAAHAHVVEVDDRLVVDDDLVLQQGVADAAEHAQPALGVLVLLGGVDLVLGLGLLGRVHGDVGAAQQRVGVLTVLREAGDADAGADLERQLVDHERLADRLEQARDDHVQDGDVVGVLGEQDPELVAAEACDEPALPDRRSDAGRAPQQHVAVVVAERVVDLLEAVKVHEQHGEAGRLTLPRWRCAALIAAWNSSRLPRPVSSSVVAIRWSFSLRLLGLQQLADQVLEDHQHQAEEDEAGDAQPVAQVHRRDRQQGGEQLGGEQRHERLPAPADRATTPSSQHM